jgi:hypothetical protein
MNVLIEWEFLHYQAGVYNCTSNYHSHGNEIIVLRPRYQPPIQPYVSVIKLMIDRQSVIK